MPLRERASRKAADSGRRIPSIYVSGGGRGPELTQKRRIAYSLYVMRDIGGADSGDGAHWGFSPAPPINSSASPCDPQPSGNPPAGGGAATYRAPICTLFKTAWNEQWHYGKAGSRLRAVCATHLQKRLPAIGSRSGFKLLCALFIKLGRCDGVGASRLRLSSGSTLPRGAMAICI